MLEHVQVRFPFPFPLDHPSLSWLPPCVRLLSSCVRGLQSTSRQEIGASFRNVYAYFGLIRGSCRPAVNTVLRPSRRAREHTERGTMYIQQASLHFI
jgi:hypothetical protein